MPGLGVQKVIALAKEQQRQHQHHAADHQRQHDRRLPAQQLDQQPPNHRRHNDGVEHADHG